MHPYIMYLLADIAAAHHKDFLTEQTPPKRFEEETEEIEKWVNGDDVDHTFGYYCGLDSINFPPAAQLNDQEMKLVIEAFGAMMLSWNQGICLPYTLPVSIAYTITVNTLNMKTSVVGSGMLTFDFCSGYAPDCIFKEYCPCLEIWNRKEDENDTGSYLLSPDKKT